VRRSSQLPDPHCLLRSFGREELSSRECLFSSRRRIGLVTELASIVVGGTLALVAGAGAEWLRDVRTSARDERNRREARQEQRDDFQRQTLIDLQDALQKYVRGIISAVHFDERERRKRQEQGQVSDQLGPVPDELDDQIHQAQVLTRKLATRVDDDQIRSWITEIIKLGTAAVLPGSTDSPPTLSREIGDLMQTAQEKMGSEIRKL
jgi:hypothetical protein